MQLLDLTLKTPEENLACEEALLDECEEGFATGTGASEADLSLSGILRFWESPQYFVVLGYSNKVHHEVHADTCEKDSIPILRRPSGGGAVLQGPGCLNYALVLRIPETGPLAHLIQTHQHILRKHQRVLHSLLSPSPCPACPADGPLPFQGGEDQAEGVRIQVQGISDLTCGDLKFSGNAQRRKRHVLLFHGTFLYGFDLGKIETYLKFPSRQPEYRGHRTHGDFLTNIPLRPEKIKGGLKQEWRVSKNFAELPTEAISKLVREKYSREEWNYKF